MRTVFLHQFNRPFSIEEIEPPKPDANKALIAVEACSVCHTDLRVADRDWTQFARVLKKPLIRRQEIAGRVVQSGASVCSVLTLVLNT
jgi:alcohol dehydrogenase, propanol-preferring